MMTYCCIQMMFLLLLLDLVFQEHREAGIKLNADKTFLFRTEVEYLGQLISQDCIKLIPEYVSKIVEWPLPSTGKELSAFLGFAGYYKEFLPGFPEITANLNEVKPYHDLEYRND